VTDFVRHNLGGMPVLTAVTWIALKPSLLGTFLVFLVIRINLQLVSLPLFFAGALAT
jgi:hypothetical protein